MYPDRYHLAALTEHVLGLLERRREGFSQWNAETEAALTQTATEALREAGRQFAEVADDPAYWARVEETVLGAALPRYFQAAKGELELEQKKFNLWRGGDFISRAAYAALGLVAALVVWRTPIPDSLELFPLTFFVVGPLLPDFQVWFAKRRYRQRLQKVVDAMEEEDAARSLYQPLTSLPAPASLKTPLSTSAVPPKNRQGMS